MTAFQNWVIIPQLFSEPFTTAWTSHLYSHKSSWPNCWMHQNREQWAPIKNVALYEEFQCWQLWVVIPHSSGLNSIGSVRDLSLQRWRINLKEVTLQLICRGVGWPVTPVLICVLSEYCKAGDSCISPPGNDLQELPFIPWKQRAAHFCFSAHLSYFSNSYLAEKTVKGEMSEKEDKRPRPERIWYTCPKEQVHFTFSCLPYINPRAKRAYTPVLAFAGFDSTKQSAFREDFRFQGML